MQIGLGNECKGIELKEMLFYTMANNCDVLGSGIFKYTGA
jgi:hypothetical protein